MGGVDSNHSGSQDVATMLQNMAERLFLVETRLLHPNKLEGEEPLMLAIQNGIERRIATSAEIPRMCDLGENMLRESEP